VTSSALVIFNSLASSVRRTPAIAVMRSPLAFLRHKSRTPSYGNSFESGTGSETEDAVLNSINSSSGMPLTLSDRSSFFCLRASAIHSGGAEIGAPAGKFPFRVVAYRAIGLSHHPKQHALGIGRAACDAGAYRDVSLFTHK